MGNHRKQFTFVVGNCVCFRSFRIHNSMNAKNVIEKLQIIAREKETQRSDTKVGGGTKCFERIEIEEELRRE